MIVTLPFTAMGGECVDLLRIRSNRRCRAEPQTGLAPKVSPAWGPRLWTLIQFLRCRAHPTTPLLANP